MRFTIGVLLTMYGLALSGAFAATGSPMAAWSWALLLIPGGVLIGIGLTDTGLVKPVEYVESAFPRQYTISESRWGGGSMPSPGPPA